MIIILDSYFKKVDILRKYTFAQFTEQFRGIGSFSINVPMIEENKYLLNESEQFYVLYETIRFGKNTYLMGVIDKIERNSESDYGDEYKILGRMIQFIFKQRVAKGTITFSGITAQFIKTMIEENITKDKTSDRYIPINVSFYDENKINKNCSKLDKQVTGDYLWGAFSESLEQDNLGLIFEPNVIVETEKEGHKTNVEDFSLIISMGADRRKGNADGNNAVIFSQSLSNIARTSYMRNLEGFTNIAYVAGEGELQDRKWYELQINDDVHVKNNKGFGRRELWIDARDIQSTDGDKTLTEQEYDALIKQRANEKATESTIETTYESTLTEQNKQYTYGVDYNIGDWATVIDEELGLAIDVQIVEVVHTLQGTGSEEITDVSFSYGKKEKINIVEQTKNNASRIETNDVNIKYLDNRRKTNEENIKDLLERFAGFDFSEFSTVNNKSTLFPVMNGKKINHREVAATLSQANYWMDGSNRIVCVRLSNNILVWFVKATTPTSVDITTAAAKGYRSREYVFRLPETIKTILFANCSVENNLNWENVEFKIHSVSNTEVKSHFWCQNSYKGLQLYWYYVFVAQV